MESTVCHRPCMDWHIAYIERRQNDTFYTQVSIYSYMRIRFLFQKRITELHRARTRKSKQFYWLYQLYTIPPVPLQWVGGCQWPRDLVQWRMKIPSVKKWTYITNTHSVRYLDRSHRVISGHLQSIQLIFSSSDLLFTMPSVLQHQFVYR